jgi:hypothetical protein
MQVVELRPKMDCENIAKALRNIADDIEAGVYDFDPNAAVVVLATESKRRERDGDVLSYDWQTHGLGKADGFFAAKGILASAVTRFECKGDD